MMLPLPDQNVTALTGVQYTQDLSENVSVFVGKLNLLDGTPTSYEQGRRLNSFLNAALQSNISRIFLLPSTLGTGFTIRDESEPIFSFYLLDTHFTPTTSGFSNFLTNGVLGYGEYRLRTDLWDLPGHNAVGFLYSTATRTSLDSNPFIVTPPVMPTSALPTKSQSWTVTYRFDQVLYIDPQNVKRQWTINGDYCLSDGNPNPIQWFANLSLVGTSPLASCDNDTVGIGYYHLGVSDVQVLKTLNFGAEDGVELYYNVAVNRWFHVTPDLQILDPSLRNNATAVLFGFRARKKKTPSEVSEGFDHSFEPVMIIESSEPVGTRTQDLRIKSPLDSSECLGENCDYSVSGPPTGPNFQFDRVEDSQIEQYLRTIIDAVPTLDSPLRSIVEARLADIVGLLEQRR